MFAITDRLMFGVPVRLPPFCAARSGGHMTKRQILLKLRDGTVTQLRELASRHNDYDQDWSDSDARALASRLMDLRGVVSLLDLGLAKRGLEKLCH